MSEQGKSKWRKYNEAGKCISWRCKGWTPPTKTGYACCDKCYEREWLLYHWTRCEEQIPPSQKFCKWCKKERLEFARQKWFNSLSIEQHISIRILQTQFPLEIMLYIISFLLV